MNQFKYFYVRLKVKTYFLEIVCLNVKLSSFYQTLCSKSGFSRAKLCY